MSAYSILIASLLISAATASVVPTSDILASEDLQVLLKMDAQLNYNDMQGNRQHVALKPTQVSVSHEPESEFYYSNLTVSTDVGKMIIVLVNQAPYTPYINHVWFNFKQPVKGYNTCLVNSINGFKGDHLVCPGPESVECLGYIPETASRPSILNKFADLVFSYLEYEVVKDGSQKHKDHEFVQEPTQCNTRY